MKKLLSLTLCMCLLAAMCIPSYAAETADAAVTDIVLSDTGITVDGQAASTDSSEAVYTSNDIIYYEDGTDSSYGEGTETDMHTQEEADAHTVVNITQPGTYRISGKLSAGQIFVDLGDGTKNDPTAVVTLILNGVDITCTVAPAVFFYRVYECSEVVTYGGGVVDTTDAGANVIIADGTTNNVDGAYVARIYKTGTTSKLHKYDGAFYSRRSMNVDGGELGTGVLNITATNEGLDSELHLTINGGIINIEADNDGINTNEDYASVFTMNGGTLNVKGGLGAEGDGIDSNGYITINGGTITSSTNETEPEGGLDADLDITINGGTIMAFGIRNDEVSTASAQKYMELSFSVKGNAGDVVELVSEDNELLFSHTADRQYQSVILSSAELKADTIYYLYVNNVLQQHSGTSSNNQMGGGQMPDGEMPADGEIPADGEGQGPGGEIPDGEMPTDWEEGQAPDGEAPEIPEGDGQNGGFQPDGNGSTGTTETGDGSVEFVLSDTSYAFYNITSSSETVDVTPDTAEPDTDNPDTTEDEEDTGHVLQFEDVSTSAWYAEAVRYAAENGLFAGTSETTFSPGIDMTRAMFVTVLWKLEGCPEAEGGSFTDVASDAYYYQAVEWAAENNIVAGYGNNIFKPTDSVSREEMAVILYQYATYKGIPEEIDSSAYEAFDDTASVADWAVEALAWTVDIGIVTGVGNNKLDPAGTSTRAQVAQILTNYCQYYEIFYYHAL